MEEQKSLDRLVDELVGAFMDLHPLIRSMVKEFQQARRFGVIVAAICTCAIGGMIALAVYTTNESRQRVIEIEHEVLETIKAQRACVPVDYGLTPQDEVLQDIDAPHSSTPQSDPEEQ